MGEEGPPGVYSQLSEGTEVGEPHERARYGSPQRGNPTVNSVPTQILVLRLALLTPQWWRARERK